jgi:hypothetical protein
VSMNRSISEKATISSNLDSISFFFMPSCKVTGFKSFRVTGGRSGSLLPQLCNSWAALRADLPHMLGRIASPHAMPPALGAFAKSRRANLAKAITFREVLDRDYDVRHIVTALQSDKVTEFQRHRIQSDRITQFQGPKVTELQRSGLQSLWTENWNYSPPS